MSKIGVPVASVPSKTLPPSIPRILDALRCIGHSLEDSVGDLADNAVSAEASKVSIAFSGQKTFDRIEISDTGHGMDQKALEDALTLGSLVEYSPDSLSKYGMGLKASALAQGGRLTVLTRADKGKLLKAVLDYRLIREKDDYVILFPQASEEETRLFKERTDGIGTVLVVDRIHRERTLGITACINRTKRMVSETYHRFMTAAAPVTFEVNGETVEPYDPLFVGDEAVVELLKPKVLEFTDEHGQAVNITVRANQLPHPPSQVNRAETKEKYGITQKNIGFYVYRANRLVRRGESFGLFTPDTKLLSFRGSIDFNPDADEFFSLDVAKRRVVLSDSVFSKLKDLLTPVINHSRTLWIGEKKKTIATNGEDTSLHRNASSQINSKASLLSTGRRDRTSPKKRAEAASPKIKREKQSPRDKVRIIEVDSIDGGRLWEPSLDSESGQVYVRINKSHPFYDAVYRASASDDPTLIDAVDYLLWALAHAEYSVGYDDDKKIEIMEALRLFASDNLKRLLSE